MADQLAIDRAFNGLCTDLLTLASLLEVNRPAGSALDFHRNAAILAAMNRCMRSGEALSDVLAPHSRAGSWRRTVEAFNRERHAAGASGSARSTEP